MFSLSSSYPVPGYGMDCRIHGLTPHIIMISLGLGRKVSLDQHISDNIDRPDLCNFHPHEIVGEEFDCDGVTSNFTPGAATIAKASWDGPRSSTDDFQWYGFNFDANISQPGMGSIVTECNEDGERCDAVPLPISQVWEKYWLLKNPEFENEGDVL